MKRDAQNARGSTLDTFVSSRASRLTRQKTARLFSINKHTSGRQIIPSITMVWNSTVLTALYLLSRSQDRRARRRRFWVHPILQRRLQFGEFHHLLQELRLDAGRFQRYFRLTRGQFDELLARVGARITRMDTNYRRAISAAERLSICLR